MSVGTNLLVRVFETFAANDTKLKTVRRLYCESGQAAAKSYRFANDSVRTKLDRIIPRCKDCKHDKLRHVTMVLVFEELARLEETELLQEFYGRIGGPATQAYRLCDKKTQKAIRSQIAVKEQSL